MRFYVQQDLKVYIANLEFMPSNQKGLYVSTLPNGRPCNIYVPLSDTRTGFESDSRRVSNDADRVLRHVYFEISTAEQPTIQSLSGTITVPSSDPEVQTSPGLLRGHQGRSWQESAKTGSEVGWASP